MNEALKAIADANDNIYLVSSEGLTCYEDELHFTAESLREFGLRYAKVFLGT